MELWWYQSEAVAAVWKHLREKTGNPVIELPTGAGKSYVIAELVRQSVGQWNGRILILQHVKELIQQNADKIQKLCPTIRIGLYSAGLNQRETGTPVVVAGIQSVYDKSDELGHFDLILIDEVHLYPDSGAGMYRQLIESFRRDDINIPVVGLTATPYRTASGPICTPDGTFNEICYSVSVKTLINQGYLSKLIGRRAATEIDVGGLAVRGGEYADDEVAGRLMAAGVVGQATDELITQCVDRRSVLVFCQTVAHAQSVAGWLRFGILGREERAEAELLPATDPTRDSHFDLGPEPLASPLLRIAADWLDDFGHPTTYLRRYIDTGEETVAPVFGETPSDARASTLAAFKAGQIKYLVNVNVLTTGFDAPNVDCVAIMRATLSPGLLYQMVGRGFRTCEGKDNCLVMDYGRNFERHGPVDDIRPRPKGKATEGDVPQRTCPECRVVVAPAVTTCPGCGYVWPVEARELTHDGSASGEPLSGTNADTDDPKAVTGVEYRLHTKKGATEDAPKTLRVTYKCGFSEYVSEWVCIEHPEGGFAHRKASAWWAKRCHLPMPDSVVAAVAHGQFGLLATPTEIVVRTKSKDSFPEIVKHTLGAIPAGPTPCSECEDVANIVVSPSTFGFPAAVCGLCGAARGTTTQAVYERFARRDPDLPDTCKRITFAGDQSAHEDTKAFDLLTEIEADDCPF